MRPLLSIFKHYENLFAKMKYEIVIRLFVGVELFVSSANQAVKIEVRDNKT